MAWMLRTVKNTRLISGFVKSTFLNTPRHFNANLVTNQSVASAHPQTFANHAQPKHDQGLDFYLEKINQDYRKTGRISKRDIDDLYEDLQSSRRTTSSQSLQVIRCCGSLVPEELPEVRTKLVQDIWSTLVQQNVKMDVSHYNALLKVYLDNEHMFSPIDFLADMEAKGIEPNQVTYQRLVARYCQEGDIEGATKILEFMKDKQLPVSSTVFNALINGHSQTGDMESAEGIVKVMEQAGHEPVVETYVALMCGYARAGDFDKISSLLAEAEQKELFLLDKDYMEIIYALALNGHDALVPSVLSKIATKSVAYNDEAYNTILRLINKDKDEAAFLVLQSMSRNLQPDGTPYPSGFFLIKHMVKADRPIEKIVATCDRLENANFYEAALTAAVRVALEQGNVKLVLGLMDELKKRGQPVRQHYFWPLLIKKGREDASGNEVALVLKKMNDFDLTPNNETLRDYVIPNLQLRSSKILEVLRDANVSLGSAAASLVFSLLQRAEIKEAALISSQVTAYYAPELMRRPLTSAFYKTGDLQSYVTVLRNFYENFDRKQQVLNREEAGDENAADSPVDKTDLLGKFVFDLTYSRQYMDLNKWQDVLQALVDQGLTISTASADKLQDKLGETMTPAISSLIGKLSSGDLTPVPITRKPPAYTPSSQMNVSQLERLISNLEAKGQETKGLKRQLFTLYYREKNLEKAEELLAQCQNQPDFIFNHGIYSQLADLYAFHENLDKAMEYLNKVKESKPDGFSMDDMKIVRIAYLLVKNGRFDEGIQLLESADTNRNSDERSNTYKGLVWRFLNSLAEEGRVEDLYKVFDTLVKKDLMEVNNVVLGPLIKVHLINDDIDKALEKFEWCVNQFRATPWKNELTAKLIQTEQADKLQKLTDLSTSVHGEINSLYDLVFSFVECGRIRQARKILETPGLQNRPQRMNHACERYQNEGMVKPLEGLKDATKNLNHIDRTDIYYQLLLSYIKQEDVDKALGLWIQTQEEDLFPSALFLEKLGTFLKEQGREVPFVMPEKVQEPPSSQSDTKFAPYSMFRHKLKVGQLDEALQLYGKDSRTFSITDSSLLIEKMLQADRLGEATKITVEMLERNVTPLSRVFRFLLNKLASSGDVDTLETLGTMVNQDVKKIVSFDNRLCHANLMAGKAEQYLNKLEKSLDDAKDSDLQEIAEKFPRGGAYGILERHPELLEKYENLAIKYAKRGIIAPLNVLWTNYFVVSNEAKSEEIWDKYLKEAPRIMFQRIVHAAREQKDEGLIRRLIAHLKSSHVTEGALGNAYSCLLDVLVANDKIDDVIPTFEEALKDSGLSHINRTAILRVKEIHDKLGKQFDHKIPPKNPRTAQDITSEDDR